MKPFEIKGGLVLIDGVATTDPKVIGERLLEDLSSAEADIYDAMHDYKKLNRMIELSTAYSAFTQLIYEKVAKKVIPACYAMPLDRSFVNYRGFASMVSILEQIENKQLVYSSEIYRPDKYLAGLSLYLEKDLGFRKDFLETFAQALRKTNGKEYLLDLPEDDIIETGAYFIQLLAQNAQKKDTEAQPGHVSKDPNSVRYRPDPHGNADNQ